MRDIFSAFNFTVLLLGKTLVPVPLPICTAGFRECRGLNMSMEAQTIREGGNNIQPIHLTGRVSYGSLTLSRGMSIDKTLWLWFERVQLSGQLGFRATCVILVWNSSHTALQYAVLLTGCVPVRIQAGDLNAETGTLAIEEIEIKYESMVLI